MPEISIEIMNKVGLHARPAALFVQEVKKFESEIFAINGDRRINAKSILEVLTLGAHQGTIILIQAEGPDADAALQAISVLHANNFGEKE